MDWKNLLSTKRFSPTESNLNSEDSRSEFHKDYDRIVFSSSFRRLGRKTQVHPLANNDHIHTRLTHSIEVGSVGRSIGHSVGKFLEQKSVLPKGISPQEIGAIVQAACLAHDIGNPPFGHAGEFAIRHWFQDNGLKLALESQNEINDFKLFEGNAQGFRVVTTVENSYEMGGLRLTYATLGTMVKYPWFSDHALAKKKCKFNFFQSEKNIVHELMKELGLESSTKDLYLRHPLSYLMEAADDICYKILDIEDALELDILRFEEVSDILNNLAGLESEKSAEKNKDTFPNRGKASKLRSEAISNLIKKVTKIFENNYDDIISGNFQGDLISKIEGIEKTGIEEAKKKTTDNIFLNRRKIELELGSYEALNRILSAYIEAANEIKQGNPSFKSKRINDLMGSKKITEQMSSHECYLLITDIVSGMTDNHATHVANQLLGQAL